MIRYLSSKLIDIVRKRLDSSINQRIFENSLQSEAIVGQIISHIIKTGKLINQALPVNYDFQLSGSIPTRVHFVS